MKLQINNKLASFQSVNLMYLKEAAIWYKIDTKAISKLWLALAIQDEVTKVAVVLRSLEQK
jgi:hypothetical protein